MRLGLISRTRLVVAGAVFTSTLGEIYAWTGDLGYSYRPAAHNGWAGQAECRRNSWSLAAASISAVGDGSNEKQRKNNILEDGAGHINRDLAERIWTWEQERRENENLPKLQYSVRSGLRLVDSTVEQVLLAKKNDENLRSDLVQEGLSALLDALSRYRHQNDEPSGDAVESSSNEDFESYARQYIRSQLQLYLEEGGQRPLKLPHAVQSVVRRANRLMAERIRAQQQRSNENDNKDIKASMLASIAEELEIPLPRLRTYLKLARATSHTLSMESTVEILHPSSLDDSSFRDQDEWELREGLLLDDGHSVQKDQVISEYLDEMTEREGDDQAWVQEEQIAGPLPELIPDTEPDTEPDTNSPTPDDLILQELIRSDLSNFLTSTLDPQEVKVVRLSFGLQDDDSSTGPRTMKQTAQELQIPDEQVSKILAKALGKLRESYNAKFIDRADDEDEEEYTVDSV